MPSTPVTPVGIGTLANDQNHYFNIRHTFNNGHSNFNSDAF
jgi:hypothetical protein